jgi:CxxC-x17-CxxC domain-containing protein
MGNKTLTCADCGNQFEFSEEEQNFFAEKGFADPKRCPDCRSAKKDQRKEKRFTKVTCAECGQEAEVPFVPRKDGPPVLCKTCFDAKNK